MDVPREQMKMKKTWLASAFDADKSVSLYVMYVLQIYVLFLRHWYFIGRLSLKLLFFLACLLLRYIRN